jgi:hypothetical protein
MASLRFNSEAEYQRWIREKEPGSLPESEKMAARPASKQPAFQVSAPSLLTVNRQPTAYKPPNGFHYFITGLWLLGWILTTISAILWALAFTLAWYH